MDGGKAMSGGGISGGWAGNCESTPKHVLTRVTFWPWFQELPWLGMMHHSGLLPTEHRWKGVQLGKGRQAHKCVVGNFS